MLTLYTFGPAFGMPDASPFVVKAEMLLKLAGLPYRTDRSGFRRAPKGKLPYIDDGGQIVADSTLIRLHIERKYGFDFDAGLTPEQRGAAWMFEKALEDHFYWHVVQARWCDDGNFARGPASFFKAIPWPVRPLVQTLIRRKIRGTLHGQGTSRFTPQEQSQILARGAQAAAELLGDKPYFFGDKPCGADATAFGFIASAVSPHFEMTLRHETEKHANLSAYVQRMRAEFFPDGSDGSAK
ncbi:glutathione S-transferase C-terminal domain-containing protein [Pandoraea nosoerga]|uniref:Glutathione S-transferase n=1 Tax=Pandoraea nosoerga TaxID=2508296 RepID=A0A5E4Y399_9BURK|nr:MULTISPECIES: glutathione S-transferase C-terminal domain-containing protein [Pandoraea]MBN4666179.1 glutathione S-transferase C-terminal domain-containing protein [Pandoraea nosoerga]MBN4676918.1 glutathione S-transferase C-terminal domain-containing protein [Pandoraea nosoerga]MBN4681587.1 glutathione S-transferase C-terminal domain-containing protein [Pandoraea nosoerga]MBN4745127.1 glutathione S-transferase C-terminal domain-containing protein [Pandoraea nosoerga]VVE43106.1 glutathione 